MKKAAGKINSIRYRDLRAGEQPARRCGECRFCRADSGDGLRCMRHKIETTSASQCREWEGKNRAAS